MTRLEGRHNGHRFRRGNDGHWRSGAEQQRTASKQDAPSVSERENHSKKVQNQADRWRAEYQNETTEPPPPT